MLGNPATLACPATPLLNAEELKQWPLSAPKSNKNDDSVSRHNLHISHSTDPSNRERENNRHQHQGSLPLHQLRVPVL